MLHTQYHGEFHSTDYFLEREFCTHHERLSPYHLLVCRYFLSMKFFLGIFLLLLFLLLSSCFYFIGTINIARARVMWCFVALSLLSLSSRLWFPFQVAQGVQDTLLSINLFNVDLPTQKEVRFCSPTSFISVLPFSTWFE